MPPREDSSMPIHIGQTIVSGMLEIKEDIGELTGKVEGMQASLSEINARVSHTVTREECAANIARLKKGPTDSSGYPAIRVPARQSPEPPDSLWEKAHKRIGVLISAAILLGLVGGTAIWMANAYQTIQRAQATIAKLDGGSP